jgi:hypothetical protein
MGMLLVRHKVRDFASWKTGFTGHRGAQMAAGLSNPRLFRSSDDPNEVVILFDMADVVKAKAFGNSPDLRTAMEAAGVIDKPTIHFLNAAD